MRNKRDSSAVSHINLMVRRVTVSRCNADAREINPLESIYFRFREFRMLAMLLRD